MAERWKPRRYQRKAVKWLLDHPEAALFLDPGLGKTSVTLAAFQLMQEAGGCRKALVIAPLRVCFLVWTHESGGELARWEQFADLKVTLLHGPKKEERLAEDADIYVVNYDGLRWLCERPPKEPGKRRPKPRLAQLCAHGVDTLIADELSKLKHTKTKRFKLLKSFLGKFRRRWGLTGSPASNGLLDLFGQAYVLDLGRSLGPYITGYRTRFFLPVGFGGYTWVPQPGAEKRIHRAMRNLALSMRAEDHLDLPKLVQQNIWVTLPPKARKAYDELEADFITALDDGVVTAANAAVVSGKCRQVASGGIYADSDPLMTAERRLTKKRKVHHVHDEKTDALVDLVDELQGQPLLVAYEFHHDLERIRGALGEDTPAIGGQTSNKRSVELVRAWNAGELPVLCGHPAAMAHGLNLQASGNHVCWYSLTWDCELYDQLIRRVWRQGSKAKRVIVHRIIARRTVDEAVVKALSKKKRVQDALLKALKQYRGELER